MRQKPRQRPRSHFELIFAAGLKASARYRF
jgi:hypothetical protein